MPTVITEGAMAARGFGFGASSAGGANYIEDVFSTYLYTGTGAAQTITNGIDLSTKGGLVWMKSRSAATDHALYDTARGATFDLVSNTTAAQTTQSTGLTAFGTTGFSIGALAKINTSAATYVSWTFREQAKFFDIVTYTGTGSNTTIAHNLGSTPGCIIVKRTDTTGNWQVYHSGLTSAAYSIQLNLTSAQASATTVWNSTAPTSSVFSVGTDASVNASGGTYVAYIYASNAGGFGAAGTDNVITCGSYVAGTGAPGNVVTVNLGYEPQWLLVKDINAANGWAILDNMRGWTQSTLNFLRPNSSDAETSIPNTYPLNITSTGFADNSSFVGSGNTGIYIAIRRGPMKTPTDATKVFSPNAYTSAASGLTTVTTGFPVDLAMYNQTTAFGAEFVDRLRGTSLTNVGVLQPRSVAAEDTSGYGYLWYSLTSSGCNTAVFDGRSTSASAVMWNFRRAPGFFDEVCYTGNGTTQNITHNLTVAPELLICKSRSAGGNWAVGAFTLGQKSAFLNTTAAFTTDTVVWNNTAPTSSVFSVGASDANASSYTYVAYLFATCPGVSKVGSYTGTAATQTINCGFTGGARFVMIKRTDSTGDWYVWDTARGMVSATDPSLLMNTSAAQVNANSVYTVTTGFQIVSTAAGINDSGGSYIFLAVA